ncbi:MAG TPA: uroporphyrinogen-III C-methyltransferase [Acidimicrobiales bacterium]
MTVYLVGAGPGDPGLLTRRGAALLARADVVLHDRLVSPAVLDLVPSSARVIDVGKDPDSAAGGAGRQEEIARMLVEHGRTSAVVVRLKGGDPFLFGRGGEEVEALAQAGLAWEVVPGVTSAFGVPAAVGIPVTQRGVAASVTVVTGRVGAADGTSEHDWAALARVGGTLVILMGMTTRAAIAAALIKGGRAPETPVAVIASGTTASQQVRRTTLRGLADVELGPPAIIVVGPVAALGQHHAIAPADGPLSGRTVVVTRAGERARELVEALERAGATALELPLTRQVEPEDGGVALQAAATAVQENDWVVLTSVIAVDRFMGALRDARALGSVLVAAVGPATAAALRRTGVEPDLVPAEHSARGLVEAFPDAPVGGTWRVLFPSADLAPATIPDGLRQKGWGVQRVEAYRTVARVAPVPALLDQVAAADALTLTAPSGVQAFLALRTAEGLPVPVPTHVVCIGPTTADAARAAGLERVHEATGASAQGIMDELIGVLGPEGQTGP